MAVLMIGEIDNSVIKVDKLKNSKSINQNKYLLLDRKKQGYKPPDLSVEKTKILSLFQAPGFRHGVNLKSKI